MKKILKIKNHNDIIYEFKYNIEKKNFLRECLAFFLNYFQKENPIKSLDYYLYRDKLLSEGFSFNKFITFLNKYYLIKKKSIPEIYNFIDNTTILELINASCKLNYNKIILKYRDSIDKIKILIDEFSSIKYYQKPNFYNKIYKYYLNKKTKLC